MIYLDGFEDQRQAELFAHRESSGSFGIEEMADLCIEGLSVCEGHCPSRSLVGQDRCQCVRARFECLEDYQFYENGRKQAVVMIAANALSMFGEDYEDGD